MDLQTILTAVESWPAEDRLRLIERVWDGLSATPEVSDLTGTQRLDLQRRLDAYRDDPKAGSSWEVVKARLQGERGVNPPLIVNPDAEADLADAKAWYDDQRAGLGDELLDCVQEVFDRLRRTPELFGKVFLYLRLARVRRFPYIVVYRIDDDQITVVAVYHTRRDPRGWQTRA